jgi:hypothetical protein
VPRRTFIHSAEKWQFTAVAFWENFPKTVHVTLLHTGRAMRISDGRYSRERFSLDLALKFLRHEARAQTIRAWTGLSDDRIRNLCRQLHKGNWRRSIRRLWVSPLCLLCSAAAAV